MWLNNLSILFVEEKSRILKKASEDKSRPVSFEDSFGGSESQFRLLLKGVDGISRFRKSELVNMVIMQDKVKKREGS